MLRPIESTATSSRKPELLAPAGDWECARAAVANGADAVYFGLPAFNARMRATNFTPDDLPKLMDFLHEHGVKGYVAFNTLIFTDELAAAEEELRPARPRGGRRRHRAGPRAGRAGARTSRPICTSTPRRR